MTLGLQQHSSEGLTKVIFVFLMMSLTTLSISIAASSIAFGITCFLLVGLLIKDKIQIDFKSPLVIAIALYCIVEAISTIYSIDRPASFINMKRLFQILTIPITLLSINNEQRMRTLLSLWLGSVALLSLYEITILIEEGFGTTRLGVFQIYMTTGGLKMFAVLLLAPFVLNSKTPRKLQVQALICLIPIFIALILTETRSSWLGMLGGIGVYGLMKDKRVLLGLALLIILFVMIAPDHLQSRAFSIFDMNHPSNVERFNKWMAGAKMFVDYPLVGVGDIDLGQIYMKYRVPSDPTEGGHLHNNFVMLLVTLGSVGIIVCLYLFVVIFKQEYQAMRRCANNWLYGNVAVGCLMAYVGFHINGIFEWNFGDHEIAILLWMSVGLVLSCLSLLKETEAREK